MSRNWEIKIVADTNDADYVTQLSKISEANLNKIKPLIEAIRAFKPYKVKRDGLDWTHDHNFPTGEYVRTDLGEMTAEDLYKDFKQEIEVFNDYVPYGEHGIHSIESIEIAPAKKWTKLL